MKILNLYSGIGGNRKLWGDSHDITAVENDEMIAQIYKDNFPNDKIVIADAHEYLEKHYKEFDFIWSSPPCPSHSRARWAGTHRKTDDQLPIFPDMKLYEEILFLQGYFKGDWVVENVRSWYKPLIEPQEVGLHYYWANFKIDKFYIENRGHYSTIPELQKKKGFDLSGYKNIKKRLLLRNCVEPEAGKHILDCLLKHKKSVKI